MRRLEDWPCAVGLAQPAILGRSICAGFLGREFAPKIMSLVVIAPAYACDKKRSSAEANDVWPKTCTGLIQNERHRIDYLYSFD